MAATQKNREIQVFTPLGADDLLFYRMNGRESVSEPFEFEVELLSEKPDINPDKLLGQPFSIGILLQDGSWRYFNGFVTRFGHYGKQDVFAYYRATIRPWLWILTRVSNCRIFENKSAPDIIKSVFSDLGFSDFKVKLTGSYAAREYCVQYRETDFNFVSRLMEEEGIHYYFTHEKGKHYLVLADSPSAHTKIANYDKIPFNADQGSTDRTRVDHIHEWGCAKEVQTGVYELTDYDFKKPKAKMQAKSKVKQAYSHSDHEFFDFPGRYTETSLGDIIVRNRIEEHQARYERCEGRCNARGLSVGHLFNLVDYPLKEQNREYWVLSATYHLRLDAYISQASQIGAERLFDCSFTAIEGKQHYRPPRTTHKPLVHGAQTAVVTGPAGEEIYTDKYGRVKVHFHWDRKERWPSGRQEQDSSCWIRVSHPWAGKQWGMVAIPRIGQEVVVDFLEGDPDQPLIVGSVYNADQMPPYDLPANMTQTGIKSRSSMKGTPDNFNELRFEDKKGSEHIFLHAEKDQTIEVEHDESHWVGHDRKKNVDNNETVSIGNNRSEDVGKNETISIGKNRTEDVGENENITIGKDREESVGGNEKIEVAKDREHTVGQNEKINIGKKHTIEVGDDRETIIGKDDKSQVSKKFYLEAGDEITLKTGDASITMKKDGTIQIKGKDITITGSGKIAAKASGDMVLKGSKIAAN